MPRTTIGGGSPVTPTQDAAEAAFRERVLPRTYLTLPPVASGLTTPCRVFVGARNGKGYGQVWVRCTDGRSRHAKAHRVALQAALGAPLPPPTRASVVDHKCDNPSCVEPSHLRLVTAQVNTLRGTGLTAAQAKATHCPQGHPYAGGNLYVGPDGDRKCHECCRVRQRAANMTPEQLERKRARHRAANMTPEQLERNRARHRAENMTPEQLERKRARDREYMRARRAALRGAVAS